MFLRWLVSSRQYISLRSAQDKVFTENSQVLNANGSGKNRLAPTTTICTQLTDELSESSTCSPTITSRTLSPLHYAVNVKTIGHKLPQHRLQ